MGKYSRITLDRDRAFDTGSIEKLLTDGKAILSEAISISKKMETSISKISGVYNGINGSYKEGALGADISSLSGTLEKDIYQDTIDCMEKILTKLINDMPSYDTSLSQEVNGIWEALNSVSGRIEDLKGLLEAGDVNLKYKEFKQRLEDLKKGWDDTTEDLAKRLAEIEKNMLGVSVAAVQYSADPVNLSTGNFVYDHEDLRIGGEIPLSFHRYYNAKDRIKGSMGRCFLHNYEMYLEEDTEEEKVTICMQDGQRKIYKETAEGIYLGQNSAMEILEKVETGFCLTAQDGYHWNFDKKGKVIREEDKNKKGITFTYNESGRLEKAAADYGAFLIYRYNETGQLTQVTDHIGRNVELIYERGKLVTVRTPQGSVYRYHYGKNGRIEEVVNSRGNIAVKNTYDDKHRIIHQLFPDGGHMEFAYEDDKHQIILTERNGSRIIYVHDGRYRNTDILYEDGTKEHFEYNAKNQRVLYTDRNGNTTRMSYDDRGNLTQIINALGEKTNLTYGADNHLLALKINGKEKLHNSYDKKGNLVSSAGADGNGNKITYDGQGRPICIEEADKSRTKLIYDERGNIIQIMDARGIETRYEYDELNRVCRTIDGNGNATLFEYDAADRIRKVTNPTGDCRSYIYNESGKVAKVTDYDGYSVVSEYNSLNKLEAITDKEGNTTRFHYDRMWNISKVEQADGGIHCYKYDADNRLKEEKFPEGGCISYTYDGNGNRTSVTDAFGNKTSVIYDALNRVTDIQEPGGGKTHYTYDAEGNLESVTDALGNCTCYTYDEMGNRTAEIDVFGNKTSFIYNPSGKIEQIIYPNGTTERYVYQDGLLKEICRADGTSRCYDYDGNRNIISVINEFGKEFHYAYDANNRMTAQQTGECGRTFVYDSVGNIKRITDENGNATDYEYSPNGNLKKVTDALGNETRYSYDCMGHLVKIEQMGKKRESLSKNDAAAMRDRQITMYEWNLEGQIIKVTDPAGDIERYAYDKNGRMSERWDRDGCHTALNYGSMGEITEILYGDGRSVMFSYDALHRLESVKDWNGTTKIVTDALGRTLSVTEPNGKTVSYEWGSVNEKISLSYPDGKKVGYQYNDRGQLEALVAGNETVSYEYDETGRVRKKKLPNGITTSYVYNAQGRIHGIRHEGEDFLETYSYRYDSAGNKILAEKKRGAIKRDSGSFGYAYDALNRLIQVTKDGKPLREYSYDAFGNRTEKKEYGENTERTIQYRYNAKNQLVSEIDNGVEKSYRYDRRGNMTEESIGEKLIRLFTFDAANRMSSSFEVTENLVKKAEYLYNGLGQRLGQDIWSMKRANNNDTETASDVLMPENPEERIRYTLDLTRDYHNMLCLETEDKNQTFYWDDNVVAMEENGEESYYLQDDLGSPLHLTDGMGTSRESYGYDEFGAKICLETGQSKNCGRIISAEDIFGEPLQPFGFTGYQMEAAGGLYFAQARRYDAGLGRFVSEDFIKGFIEAPFTLNRYGYCWNRPLDLVDLDGLWPKWLETTAKVVTVTVAAAAVVTAVAAASVATGGAAVAIAVGAGAAAGGVVSGFANEAKGGSYINGWVGGAVSGGAQAGLMYIDPWLGIPGGAVNGVGSAITDQLDNWDPTNNKYKTGDEIAKDVVIAGAKGMIYSIPGSLMGWMTKYAEDFPAVTDALMTGYTKGFGEGLNQFYGLIDNILLGIDDGDTEQREGKE